ncbi:amidase family protein [Anaerorhabdus sp.]|uniref:amidase family protein n=1 Tax=Anaerorhabdus sp. TaxID=1872524 RepID=UPI002FC7FF25
MNKQLMNSVACLNPYKSVEKVLTKIEKNEDRNLIGIKNVKQIPSSLINKLEASNKYLAHTLDAHSLGGRAIDINLINPISGRYMTGSSSGTAINVLVGINDIGIGTDGGGSVLAPALSVNCFGIISPLIEKENMTKYSKRSTDGIMFSPSIGFITREYKVLLETFELILGNVNFYEDIKVFTDIHDETNYSFDVEKIEFSNQLDTRKVCIDFLKENLDKCDVMISQEGPVDLEGFGDTIFGHFDETTQAIQRSSKKGFVRVANMVDATCLVVPKKEFAQGYVLMCESKKEKIDKMFCIAEQLVTEEDKLITNYFSNLNMYFEEGYGG